MTAPHHEVAIMACARWETPYITEWLLYHRSIGFDHVYLYCNDDDPAELYAQVLPFIEMDRPFVTFHHFPLKGRQFQMYMHGLRHYRTQAEWLMFLDVDEFLRLGDGRDIKRFVDTVPPHWSCVQFNWVFFGHSGFATRPPGSVLLQYRNRAARPHRSTKTLTRSTAIDLARIDRLIYFWHGWEDALGPHAISRNVLGQSPEDLALDGNEIADPEICAALLDRAIVHHYAFKSRADFRLRFERGVEGDFKGQVGWKKIDDAGQTDAVLAPMNAVYDPSLADYWSAYLGRAAASAVPPRPVHPNLALHKPADQSSRSDYSIGQTPADDATGAVNGRITGGFQFHTDHESAPWWQVDLGSTARLHEIRIFNRLDNVHNAARFRHFAIEASRDAQHWFTIATKTDDTNVGGADGSPFRLSLARPLTARAIRIRLLEPGCLHLDQVEVYGEAPEDEAAAGAATTS